MELFGTVYKLGVVRQYFKKCRATKIDFRFYNSSYWPETSSCNTKFVKSMLPFLSQQYSVDLFTDLLQRNVTPRHNLPRGIGQVMVGNLYGYVLSYGKGSEITQSHMPKASFL